VEIIPEGFFHGKRAPLLKELARRAIPVVVHSVELSLGSDEPMRYGYIDQILEIASKINCIALSDHVCMTRSGGIDIGQLTTIAYTEESLGLVCRKIDALDRYTRKRLGPMPLVFENITHRFQVPHSSMTEPEFLTKMHQKTGAEVLLDATNLYINSVNFGFDPYGYLDQLIQWDPHLNFIRGIHLAGGEWEEHKLYDTHSRHTHPEVWDIFRTVISKATPSFIIVEWDQNPPSVGALYGEVHKALSIWNEVRGGEFLPRGPRHTRSLPSYQKVSAP